jgi:zinc/manganese transport system permease protein
MLIGPAATALRLTRQIVHSLVVAAAVGIGGTWLGVLLAYDSASWDSSHQGLPVSFFIVAVFFVAYLGSGLVARRAGSGRAAEPGSAG